jgi:hypothetical protein
VDHGLEFAGFSAVIRGEAVVMTLSRQPQDPAASKKVTNPIAATPNNLLPIY